MKTTSITIAVSLLGSGLLLRAQTPVLPPPDFARATMAGVWQIAYLQQESTYGYSLRSRWSDGSGDAALWGRRIFLSNSGGGLGFTFTPDGRTLLTSSTDGIFLQENGNERRSIKGLRWLNFEISPDGTKLLYTKDLGTAGMDIYSANLDGTQERRLTDALRDDSSPTWAPDGRILYQEGLHYWLMVMNGDGTEKHALREDKARGRLVFSGASFSPDGRMIVAGGGVLSRISKI